MDKKDIRKTITGFLVLFVLLVFFLVAFCGVLYLCVTLHWYGDTIIDAILLTVFLIITGIGSIAFSIIFIAGLFAAIIQIKQWLNRDK